MDVSLGFFGWTDFKPDALCVSHSLDQAIERAEDLRPIPSLYPQTKFGLCGGCDDVVPWHCSAARGFAIGGPFGGLGISIAVAGIFGVFGVVVSGTLAKLDGFI